MTLICVFVHAVLFGSPDRVTRPSPGYAAGTVIGVGNVPRLTMLFGSKSIVSQMIVVSVLTAMFWDAKRSTPTIGLCSTLSRFTSWTSSFVAQSDAKLPMLLALIPSSTYGKRRAW